MTKRIWIGLGVAATVFLMIDLAVSAADWLWNSELSSNAIMAIGVVQIGVAAMSGSWIAGRGFFLPMLLLYATLYAYSLAVLHKVSLGEVPISSIAVQNWHWTTLGLLAVAAGTWIGLQRGQQGPPRESEI